MIQIGDPDKMEVTQHSINFKGELYDHKSVELDLDNDGGFDLRFSSVMFSSQGFGSIPMLFVECTGSISLSDELADRVVYYSSGTHIFPYVNTIISFDYIKRSCTSSSLLDDSTVTSPNVFAYQPMKVGDVLSASSEFRSCTGFLIRNPSFGVNTSDSVTVDTTYSQGIFEARECLNFPLDLPI